MGHYGRHIGGHLLEKTLRAYLLELWMERALEALLGDGRGWTNKGGKEREREREKGGEGREQGSHSVWKGSRGLCLRTKAGGDAGQVLEMLLKVSGFGKPCNTLFTLTVEVL